MILIIIISILIGIIFTYVAYKLDTAPFCPEWIWYCMSFFLSSLSSYIILFHIFIK